jgi:hypothetical protein
LENEIIFEVATRLISCKIKGRRGTNIVRTNTPTRMTCARIVARIRETRNALKCDNKTCK